MNEQSQKELSVVVPVFNEAGNITELHQKIVSALRNIGKSFEVIFVDDGSTDGTNKEARALTPLKLLTFRKNFGQTAAFDAGFKVATGKIVITLDGDLQNDPKDISLLLQKMTEGFDVVSGWRYERKDPLMKRFFSRGADLLRKILLNDHIHDSGCSLKAYKRECFDSLNLFGEMHRFIPALLELEGYKIGEVKVSHYPRIHGKTKYTWRRTIKGFTDMIAIWFWRKYASRPIHFFGGAGLILISAGSVILLWMAIEKIILGTSISERVWPLMGALLTLIGVQFFIFGILADIAVKNYYKNHKRMNYNIKETIEL